MTHKQKLWIAGTIAVGALLALSILLFAKPAPEADPHGHGHDHGHEGHDHEGHEHGGHEHDEGGAAKGPHGGQLLSEGDFAAELKLVEEGGSARYRVWLYKDNKPLPPAAVKISAKLTRPSGDANELPFETAGDAFQSGEVAEPHVFEGTLVIQTADEPYIFSFSADEGFVGMSDQQLQSAGIALGQAGPARIDSSLQLPGEIKLNEDRTAHVVPRVVGIVEKVHVDLGQQVKAGQVLAAIASTELSEQRSALLSAERRLELARETFTREKKLWEEKISAEMDYLQARQALREAEIEAANARQKLKALGAERSAGQLNLYELRAPFAATVLEKHISIGETLKDDANVFTLGDLSTVWTELSVPAKDLNRVRVGETVRVRATAFDSQATGKISYVGALVGEDTRTAKARVVLPNPQGTWRPGLFVTVDVVSEQADVPVAVSIEAIQSLNDSTVVFVRVPGGFVPQSVELGRSDGSSVEVRKGLKAGTQYAARGSFVVKAELGKATAEHSH